jgi:nitrogen fixation NifU-like protein
MDFRKAKSRMLRHVTLPSHQGTIADPSGRAIGVGNCGDSLEVTLRVQGDRISEIRHQPNGCAFTIACASAMSELALGRTLDRALEITPQDIERELGGLPQDHLHCARLAVNTLGEAIAECYRRPGASSRAPTRTTEEENNLDADIRHSLP